MGNQDGWVGLAPGLDDRTRDAGLHKLGDHYAAGRLTAQELDSRIQAALGAETEADLAAVLADLDAEGDESTPRPSWRRRRGGTTTTPAVRLAAGLLVVAVGGVLLALVGPGPAAAELGVALAAGLLGYLTHWWLTPQPAVPSPADRSAAPARPTAPVLRDEGWRPEDSDEAVIEAMSIPDPAARLRSIRPQGRGSGIVPTQRSGD